MIMVAIEMDQMQLNSLVELRDQLSQMQETGLVRDIVSSKLCHLFTA
jgi:hypothetical protein